MRRVVGARLAGEVPRDDVGEAEVTDDDGVVVAAEGSEHGADVHGPTTGDEESLAAKLGRGADGPLPQAPGDAGDLGERLGPLGLDAERMEPPRRPAGEAAGGR